MSHYVIAVFEGETRVGFVNGARSAKNAGASFITTDGRYAQRFGSQGKANNRAGCYNSMKVGTGRTARALPLTKEIEDAR